MEDIKAKIDPEVAEMLKHLQDLHQISMDQTINRAVTTEYYFQTLPPGTKVLIHTPDDEIKEVIFK